MKKIPVRISMEDGSLIVKLPLTTPKEKTRVKRKDAETGYGLTLRTRKTPFAVNDYVEWQISYAADNPPDEGRVESIRLGNQIGFELTKLLCNGLKSGIIDHVDIEELIDFVNSVTQNDTLEENERILREECHQEMAGGFRKLIEKTPLFVKNNPEKGYFVEIVLKHKQRAVGLQAMVYLCIFINALEDEDGRPLIGRAARPKEMGVLKIDGSNKEMILDTVRAFAIASQKHKDDIRSILEQVMEKCRD